MPSTLAEDLLVERAWATTVGLFLNKPRMLVAIAVLVRLVALALPVIFRVVLKVLLTV